MVILLHPTKLGHPSIDAQHEELLALAREYQAGVAAGCDGDYLADAMGRLVEFAVHHFRCEEAEMRRLHYPDLDRHLAAHEDLIQRLSRLDFEFARSDEAPGRLLVELVRHWIGVHLETHDRRFGEFLAGHIVCHVVPASRRMRAAG